METILKKWGNSLGIRLPKAFTEQIDVSEGSRIKMEIDKNSIRILKADRKKDELEKLMSGVTEKNLHNEIESGGRKGNEIW